MRYTDGLPSQNSLSSEFPSVSSVCTKPNARRAAVCAHLPIEACAGHTVLTAVLSHGTVRDLAHRLFSVIDIHADYDEPSTTYNNLAVAVQCSRRATECTGNSLGDE